MVELTDKKISIFGFVWFCLAFFGFNGYNLVTVKPAGINKQNSGGWNCLELFDRDGDIWAQFCFLLIHPVTLPFAKI
jgi:hypothetical protein